MTEFEIRYMYRTYKDPTGYQMDRPCQCVSHNFVRDSRCSSEIRVFTEEEKNRCSGNPECFEPILVRIS